MLCFIYSLKCKLFGHKWDRTSPTTDMYYSICTCCDEIIVHNFEYSES